MAARAFSGIAAGPVGVRQLEVQAAVVIQLQRLLQVRDGLGVLAQARERQPQRGVRGQHLRVRGQRRPQIRHRLLGLFQPQQAVARHEIHLGRPRVAFSSFVACVQRRRDSPPP